MITELMCQSCGRTLTVVDKMRTKKWGYCYECSLGVVEPSAAPAAVSGVQAGQPSGRPASATAHVMPGPFLGEAPGILTGGIVVGAVLACIGSFLPWAYALGREFWASGTEGDGVITILLAFAGATVALMATANDGGCLPRWGAWVSLVSGSLVALIALYNLYDLMRVINALETPWGEIFDIEPGEGLFLTLAGGIVMALCAGLALASTQGQLGGEQSRPEIHGGGSELG